MIPLWLIAVALLAGYLLFRQKVSSFITADVMFPGPLSLPIIGNTIQIVVYRYDLFNYVRELCWYYRRSFRWWIGTTYMVFLFEARDVEKVFSSTAYNQKSDLYDSLYDWLGLGLLTSSGAKWKKSRKILTPAFHFTILENFLEIFQRNGVILVKKLEEKIGSNFDVYEPIKLYALDNICEAAMGTQVNAQVNPQSDYVTAIKAMCRLILTRILTPWYWPAFIFHRTSLGKLQRESLKVIHGLTNRVIAERKEMLQNAKPDDDSLVDDNGVKKRRVFIDILLQSSEEGGLTTEEIREEVDTFMFEGHDTVTSAISFALYCFSENHVYQEKAFQELMTIFGDDDRAPSYDDLQKMKYLELCIKETLRLYPSVPFFARTAPEDIVLDDRAIIPKGADVIALCPCLHRNPFIWENAEEFRPERFELEASLNRHPYQYVPFSAGPRNCIGMRFAMMEMKSALSTILRNFKILPASPHIPLKLDVDLILVSGTGIHIRIAKR